MPGVAVLAAVPGLLVVERGNGQWWGELAQCLVLAQRSYCAAGHCQDQVGAGQHLYCRAPVWQGQGNTAAQALGGQRTLDLVEGIGAHGHQHMRACQPVFKGKAAAGGQHLAIGNADEMVGKQGLGKDVLRQLGEQAQCQVQFPIEQLRQHGFAAGLADGQVHPGCGLAQVAQQGWQDDPRGVVGQRQPETALGFGWLELWGGQQAVEIAQGIL
ncbi:hypothetical protein D3C80_1408450 [compost metagenome]